MRLLTHLVLIAHYFDLGYVMYSNERFAGMTQEKIILATRVHAHRRLNGYCSNSRSNSKIKKGKEIEDC